MPKRKLQFTGILRDEQAVALTEFCVAIPILLLFFFAMLQYFAVVQASQLGNYAAYVAARVYAVRGSIDAKDAQKQAEFAAAMALAPIARPVPGEFGGPSFSMGSAFNSFLGTKAGNYLAGLGMASKVRLNKDLLGGSVTAKVEGSPKQVNVYINYPQPIYMPGLAEMWNFVAGDRIYLSAKSARQGLQGIPGKLLPVYETTDQAKKLSDLLATFDPGVSSSLGSVISSVPTVLLPYINVQSKCSIGYYDWGSKNPEYRPRKPAKGNEADGSGKTDNPDVTNAQNKVEQTDKDRKAYEAALDDAKKKCSEMCQAKKDLDAAHKRDDPIINSTSASASDKAKAQTDLNKFQSAFDSAQSANNAAQSKLESARAAIQNDTGQSFPSFSCNCP